MELVEEIITIRAIDCRNREPWQELVGLQCIQIQIRGWYLEGDALNLRLGSRYHKFRFYVATFVQNTFITLSIYLVSKDLPR